MPAKQKDPDHGYAVQPDPVDEIVHLQVSKGATVVYNGQAFGDRATLQVPAATWTAWRASTPSSGRARTCRMSRPSLLPGRRHGGEHRAGGGPSKGPPSVWPAARRSRDTHELVRTGHRGTTVAGATNQGFPCKLETSWHYMRQAVMAER